MYYAVLLTIHVDLFFVSLNFKDRKTKAEHIYIPQVYKMTIDCYNYKQS